MSLHELQELLFLSHNHGAIDDEELLLLYEEFLPKNPDFSYENYDRLDLNDMNDSECLAEFRVKKRDLPILAEALQIPDSFTCSQRSLVSGMEGLCILLRRLAYPCRYSDIIPRFGLPVPVLSMVYNLTLFMKHMVIELLNGIPLFSALLIYKFTVMLWLRRGQLYRTVLVL